LGASRGGAAPGTNSLGLMLPPPARTRHRDCWHPPARCLSEQAADAAPGMADIDVAALMIFRRFCLVYREYRSIYRDFSQFLKKNPQILKFDFEPNFDRYYRFSRIS
jgi:hypothetical protein